MGEHAATPSSDDPSTPPAPKRRRFRWRRRLAVYGSAYLVFFLLMSFGGCADRLILHPSTDPIAVAGGTRIAVPAPGRAGGTVEVWTGRPAAGRGRARGRGARAGPGPGRGGGPWGGVPRPGGGRPRAGAAGGRAAVHRQR